LRALEKGIHPRNRAGDDPRLVQNLFGLDFPNPVGIAAGYDKDARVYNALFSLGFGFAEAGTITPRPQPGNPRPRVFRLMRERAIINRLGFNSGGQVAALARLAAAPPKGVLGINIGANKDSADQIADYVSGVTAFAPHASYLTINISSPNTPGLRDLQAPERLNRLLEAVMAARDGAARRVPVVVKLAPDIADDQIGDIVECLIANRVDGAILTNTTLARNGIGADAHRGEAGGLSGRPLFRRATRFLAKVHLAAGKRLPLIGAGGIDNPAAALAKILAGASLLQLYTGLVYEGPGLVSAIQEALITAIQHEGKPLGHLTGREAENWAALSLDV
jgi:dihydroorotate dehydrogenase